MIFASNWVGSRGIEVAGGCKSSKSAIGCGAGGNIFPQPSWPRVREKQKYLVVAYGHAKLKRKEITDE
jgi:hypothetical protein